MKLFKLSTNRFLLVGLLLLLQLLILFGIIWRFQDYFVYFYAMYVTISIFAVLNIINSRRNPAYKIAWLIPVILLPYFGVFIYLVFGHLYTRKTFKTKMKEISEKEKIAIKETIALIDVPAELEDADAKVQSKYLNDFGILPLFKNSSSKYLPIGEDNFEEIKKELRKAKKYIFMEYFIVEEGKMWNEILEILEQKVKEGLDVRFMYDDFGCMFTLPQDYYKQLEAKGIKCSVFNPLIPVLSSIFNNRDHRKITVIDGKVAFTGGINLADEYINEVVRFGHWKDTGIVMHGDVAWGFTLMFLTLWDFIRGEEQPYSSYYPGKTTPAIETTGYYQPFSDTPFDDELVSNTVYLNLINRAKNYIYITTPYLIIDNTLMEALCSSAKSGIDVRIQTPHIPDKWYVHSVTRSNYDQLIEAGVRIFEYTPGFIHSKTFVVDDLYAVVGTINMDYRSLYLHIECGVWMYQTETVHSVHEDFIKTQAVCQEITLKDVQDVSWLKHLGRSILNVFAPLM